jgi:hypothetical protein
MGGTCSTHTAHACAPTHPRPLQPTYNPYDICVPTSYHHHPEMKELGLLATGDQELWLATNCTLAFERCFFPLGILAFHSVSYRARMANHTQRNQDQHNTSNC